MARCDEFCPFFGVPPAWLQVLLHPSPLRQASDITAAEADGPGCGCRDADCSCQSINTTTTVNFARNGERQWLLVARAVLIRTRMCTFE